MILRLGNINNQVKELQIILGLTPDGIFGKITESEVKKFQKENGLLSDGIVGPTTWRELLKKQENKIVPVCKEYDKNEDLSDPEDEIKVESIPEGVPTCENTIELINFINSINITRNIKRLVFHCTATNQNATISSIQKYWKETLKWNNPGYHIIVKPDGSWTNLQDLNKPSNGVAGYNSTSIHISYIGGIDSKGKAKDNRTDDQNRILETCYQIFKDKIDNITFHGHYEFSNKACPSFNVEKWIKSLYQI